MTSPMFSSSTPNFQLFWDATSLGRIKQCARHYQYSTIEGLQTKTISIHLEFGMALHECLELYYKTLAATSSWKEASDAASLQSFNYTFKEPTLAKNAQNLVRTVALYTEHYKNSMYKPAVLPDGKTATEYSFRIPAEITIAEEPITLCGHIDNVLETDGIYFIVDYKTTGNSLGDFFFKGFSPSNQLSLYYYAGQNIFPFKIHGILVDGIAVLQKINHFARATLTPSKFDLLEWKKGIEILLQQAYSYAVAGYWPMNDMACSNYRSEKTGSVGCPYRALCLSHPSYVETLKKQDFVVSFWDPTIER